MLTPGSTVPMEGEFMIISEGPKGLPYNEVFAGKTVVVFGLPGAMTPTCSEKQLPGYLEKLDEFKAKGVDTVTLQRQPTVAIQNFICF